MARYFVGDIQGCVRQLETALTQVNFDPHHDELWCVGDIVGRGPDSLASLQLLQQLGPAARITLGNHDLNLLAVLTGIRPADPSDRLDCILALPESAQYDWIDWLIKQPLLQRDGQLVMTHAGIYPWWSIDAAEGYAREVETALQAAWQQQQLSEFLTNMYGNEPSCWTPTLRDMERWRFIINAFTRMRYCDEQGNLDLGVKTAPTAASVPHHLKPWFTLRPVSSTTIIFGHWAALMGATHRTDIIGLDTGCVWGEYLTLMQWPSGHRITVPGEQLV